MDRRTKLLISGLIFAVAFVTSALLSERKGRQGGEHALDAARQLPRPPQLHYSHISLEWFVEA